MRAVFLRLLVVICIVGCSGNPDLFGKKKNRHQSQLEQIRMLYPDAQMTDTGLFFMVTQPGEGETTPRKGAMIKAHYTGMLLDGREFDSSFGGAPLHFKVGRAKVIEGWDQAFLQMKKGEKRRLIIPSRLAYGVKSPGFIPSHSILVFDVELLDFEDQKRRAKKRS